MGTNSHVRPTSIPRKVISLPTKVPRLDTASPRSDTPTSRPWLMSSGKLEVVRTDHPRKIGSAPRICCVRALTPAEVAYDRSIEIV